MSFPRLALFACPVLALSSFVLATDNPFARWDRLNRIQEQREAEAFGRTSRDDTLVARPGALRGSSVRETPPQQEPVGRRPVAYFSPAGESAATKPAAAAPTSTASRTAATQGVVTERLKVGQPGGTTATAARPRPGNTIQPASATRPTTRQNTVRQATFQPAGGPTIQQTAAQFGDDTNPFALNDGEPPLPDFAASDEPAEPPTPSPFAAPEYTADPAGPADSGNPFADFAAAATAEPAAAAGELVVPDAGPAFGNGDAASPFLMPEPASAVEASTPAAAVDVSETASVEVVPEFATPAAVEPIAIRPGAAGPQTPAVTVRWEHDASFNVGQNCACRMIVENTGASLVSNVVAEAVLPGGLDVISAEPAPVATGESATWTFGELKPGQSRAVDLVVVPKGTGDVDLNAYVRFTGASSSRFTVEQPLLAVSLTGPKNVEVGQSVSYTVEVKNPGTGKANNVVIQAVVPEGLQHRQGRILTIEIGTLNAGESRRARLSLTGVAGGDQQLAVRVIGDGDLSEQTIETVSVAEPKLNIGVRGPTAPIAQEAAVYEVVVVNEGRVDSNNVRAKYKLPAGFDYVSADRGGKYNKTEGTIEWFVGTLEPGKMKHMSVSLKATKDGESKHQVGVISEHGKMTMAEHKCRVQGMASLDLKFTSDATRIRVQDGEATFEIAITNNGTATAEAVGLSCEVPPAMELVEVSGPSEYISDSGVIIFRSLPKLGPGETATFVVRTTCSRTGRHTARVRVASKSIRKALIDELTVNGI